ncbi:MAG: hypothetical protein HFF90_13735 [Oscillibacter sp.]|nr:hypothetical protein [Oscillibacter sp.]
MADTRRNSESDWSWFIIIGLFVIFWPIGLLTLFAKLFGPDGKSQGQQAPPLQGAASAAQAAARFSKNVVSSAVPPRASRPQQQRQTKAKRAAKRFTKAPKVKKSNARLLKVLGTLLVLISLFAIDDEGVALQYLAMLTGGLAMIGRGMLMTRQLRRFSRYLLVMGEREAVPVDELARTLGYSPRRVVKDLQSMIDKGYFGGKAYLNLELGYIFRSSGADAAFRQRMEEAAQQQQQEKAAPPKEAEEGYSGILRNIRRTNDRIADPVLSAKIDRLEVITAKIFKAVEEDPKKAARIDTFLNYYLPTTQKLLNSYAEFEAAGVEGENLRQAKERIESTMDSIVKGFEHQLDELYKADALDVDTDIRVMEHMLKRDTGSAAEDFNLE